MNDLELSFISSHVKGGQHTNGPDYGKVTVRSPEGVYLEIQTHPTLPSHLARQLAIEAVECILSKSRKKETADDQS